MVAFTAVSGTLDTWNSLMATVLPRYAWTTVKLVVLVGIGTAAVGTATAWLVTTCSFPFRRTFEIVLALPLAFPAYVLAYAYTDLLDHPGAVQTALRNVTGWGPQDYWFPEIRSLGGAAAMLISVLYPYVYLLARAAFLKQSPTAYFAARTLGHSAWSAFWRISLPIARPAIAGGVILALMETIADFGTVAHFGVQTFATGIYSAWFSMGDRMAASQLALCLLVVALAFALMERAQRGAAKRFPAGSRHDTMKRHSLGGWPAAAAFFACLLPVALGFVIPLVVLTNMAIDAGRSPFSPRYLDFVQNSLTLAAITAVVPVAAATVVGFCARIAPSLAARFSAAAAGIGYAVPGGVIAVGLLLPFAAIDNTIDAWARSHLGISTGLLFTGSIGLLVVAYMVRFIAAALGAFDTGISAIIDGDGVIRTPAIFIDGDAEIRDALLEGVEVGIRRHLESHVVDARRISLAQDDAVAVKLVITREVDTPVIGLLDQVEADMVDIMGYRLVHLEHPELDEPRAQNTG